MRHELAWSVEETDAAVVMVVCGDLVRRSATNLAKVLRNLLLDRGRLLVDVSGVHLGWPPAAALFGTALSSAGGWPLARLVLVDGGGSVTAGMCAAGFMAEVPVVTDRISGRVALGSRPRRVRRASGLPLGPRSPGFARELVRSACKDWGVENELRRAETIANELVTNAVVHTSGRSALVLSHDHRGLTVAVWDAGTSDVVALTTAVVPADSFGLRIVEELSDHWGVTPHDDGKTVWALIAPRSVKTREAGC